MENYITVTGKPRGLSIMICMHTLSVYKDMVSWVKTQNNIEIVKDLLHQNKLNLGICYYMKSVFDVTYDDMHDVFSKYLTTPFLTLYPSTQTDIKGVVEILTARIEFIEIIIEDLKNE